MSIPHRHLVTAAIAAFSLTAGAAFAQPGPGPGPAPGPGVDGGARPAKVKIACAADVQHLCPNQATGRGAAKRCLKAHPSEVSPRCAQALQYAKEQKRARRAAAAQSSARSGAPAPGDMPPPSGGNVPPR